MLSLKKKKVSLLGEVSARGDMSFHFKLYGFSSKIVELYG
jgi:hypothetical protein